MDEQDEPTVKRTGAEAAFNLVRKQVADRNEAAHNVARKLRQAHEQRKAAERRKRDLL
jgi:hypothetical protein